MHDTETVLGMGEQGEGVLSQWLEGFVDRAIAADQFAPLDQIDTVSLQVPTLGFQKAVIKAREYLVEHTSDETLKAPYLNNLSNDYAAAGRDAEAMEASEEAMTIYRRLAAANPARHEPDLVSSLNTWSNSLSAAGRGAEAMEASEEAVTIYRRLAAANPARYEPKLALSLGTVANRLEENSEVNTAVGAVREAIETLSDHFLGTPSAFAGLMGQLITHYMRLANEAGSPLDEQLLTPLSAKLEEMAQNESKSEI